MDGPATSLPGLEDQQGYIMKKEKKMETTMLGFQG